MNSMVPVGNLSQTGISNSGNASHRGWTIPFGQNAFCVRLVSANFALAHIVSPEIIDVRVHRQTVRFFISQAALQLVFHRLEPLVLWDRLAPSEKAEVTEVLLSQVLQHIENECGATLSLTEIGRAKDGELSANCGFEVQWQGLNVTLCADLPSEMAEKIRRWSNRLPRNLAASLATSVSIRLGYAWITASEVAALSIGDAIVLDWRGPGNLVAITSEQYLAACSPHENGFVLREKLLSVPVSTMRHFMSNDIVNSELNEQPQSGRLQDIPIKLVFEVGRIEMPLNQLENIGDGYIFPFPRAPSETVDIIAQGRIVGQGEVITLDGLTAVRVTRLNP